MPENGLVPKQNTSTRRPDQAAAGVQVTFTKTELMKELAWLQDPAKLADQTKHRLRNGNAEEKIKALEIVRLASGRMKCVVSWNHLINHRMSEGRAPEAIKLYNEVWPSHPPGALKCQR